jgi:hypothetical protein
MISCASPGDSRRPDRVSTFASLCRRARSASCASQALTARTPSNLFATMLTPVPEPQASTARSASPADTSLAARAACPG